MSEIQKIEIESFINRVEQFFIENHTQPVDYIKSSAAELKSLGVSLEHNLLMEKSKTNEEVFNRQRLLDSAKMDLNEAKQQYQTISLEYKSVHDALKTLTSIVSNMTTQTEYSEGGSIVPRYTR